jgi:TrmH family RNA methyltransferase
MPLSRLHIVLVRPTHAGNLGACARAMKTMGLESLRLVRPCPAVDAQSQAMAAGADDVLERAVMYDTLDEAIRDCGYVLGTSARDRRIGWPVFAPRGGAAMLLEKASAQPVALLFGQERTGLTNDELDRCHALVTIPANPDYSSLNIASALQIMAYEIYTAAGSSAVALAPAPVHTPAPHEEMHQFYRHLQQVMTETGFLNPAKPRYLMRRLVRLFNRAQPDTNEINILRGILTSVQRPFPPKD